MCISNDINCSMSDCFDHIILINHRIRQNPIKFML